MDNNTCCRNEHFGSHNCRNNNRFNHGPSSFYMQDSSLVFKKIALNQGDAFLDLGCGAGDYSMYAAKEVGETGSVYALDYRSETVDNVCKEAEAEGIKNIHPVVSDIRQKIDIPDKSIDACLIATVLHTIDFSSENVNLFAEVSRVLKPGGKLAVIECQKNHAFGPPMDRRMSADELVERLGKYGFSKNDYMDMGANYFAMFILKR